MNCKKVDYKQSIEKAFKSANLPVKFVEKRYDFYHIHQLIVANVRQRGKKEFFEISIKETAIVRVLDTQNKYVLLMTEELVRPGVSGRKRRFLFGYDERRIFISSLAEEDVKTVKEAFESLKPVDVKDAEFQGKKVKRQGEWFFIPISKFISCGNDCIMEKEPLNRLGNPHVADVLVSRKLEFPRYSGDRIIRGEFYAKGSIRHGDHSTLHLKGWHLVARANEVDNQLYRD